jgi:hypothetical protein
MKITQPKDNIMAGTRTAPLVDGLGGTYKVVSFRWADYTGEKRTDSYRVDAAAVAGEIEALAVALQAGSNATLYEIQVAEHYVSVPIPSLNADEAVWENAASNVVIQYKHPTLESIRCFVPSPDNAMFVEGTENVDPANAEFLAIRLAFGVLQDIEYRAVGVRFTHRLQINQQETL